MAKKSKRRRAQREVPVAIEVEDESALASAFFASPPSTPPVEMDVPEALPAPDLSPQVRARRARFTRYVTGVVAAGLALCAVATIRVAVARAGSSRQPSPVYARAAAPPDTRKAPDVAAKEPEVPAIEPAPKEDAAEGATLARRAQLALESGRVAAAIEDAERATTLAPTDSFGWLVLGAAYEAKGDGVLARRAYRTCKERSGSSAFNECAALLLR